MNKLLVLKVEYPEDLDMIKDAFYIRRKVFGEEQNISEEEDFDGNDNESIHLIVYKNITPVSCGRLRLINGHGELERISTIKEFRGLGFGSQILSYMIDYCKVKGINKIRLDSYLSSKEFYNKFGFNQEGDVFEEAKRPYVQMVMEDVK